MHYGVCETGEWPFVLKLLSIVLPHYSRRSVYCSFEP